MCGPQSTVRSAAVGPEAPSFALPCPVPAVCHCKGWGKWIPGSLEDWRSGPPGRQGVTAAWLQGGFTSATRSQEQHLLVSSVPPPDRPGNISRATGPAGSDLGWSSRGRQHPRLALGGPVHRMWPTPRALFFLSQSLVRITQSSGRPHLVFVEDVPCQIVEGIHSCFPLSQPLQWKGAFSHSTNIYGAPAVQRPRVQQ